MIEWSKIKLDELATRAATPPLDDSQTQRALRELEVRQVQAQISAARWGKWAVAAAVLGPLLTAVVALGAR
jgi:hypothetical protein